MESDFGKRNDGRAIDRETQHFLVAAGRHKNLRCLGTIAVAVAIAVTVWILTNRKETYRRRNDIKASERRERSLLLAIYARAILPRDPELALRLAREGVRLAPC